MGSRMRRPVEHIDLLGTGLVDYKDLAMPGLDGGRDALGAEYDQASQAKESRAGTSYEALVYQALHEGGLTALLDAALDGAMGLKPSDLGDEIPPGVRAAIEAYRSCKSGQGGPMSTNVRRSSARRPQTITRDLAGKWIAWSEDGLKIVAVGDSFEDCERKAVEAGHSPNRVAIEGVPLGRFRDEVGG
jgi:hypothetical protein